MRRHCRRCCSCRWLRDTSRSRFTARQSFATLPTFAVFGDCTVARNTKTLVASYATPTPISERRLRQNLRFGVDPARCIQAPFGDPVNIWSGADVSVWTGSHLDIVVVDGGYKWLQIIPRLPRQENPAARTRDVSVDMARFLLSLGNVSTPCGCYMVCLRHGQCVYVIATKIDIL